KLYNSVFRIKSFPAFVLPFAWIPATQSERKSGFLLPTTGTSNQKGRTFKTAYYQTLGQSADITFRSDVYSSRGLGLGAEFRAQTDERSFMRLGFFSVKDRLFGDDGENQGGTAFIGEGVQYLPRGWLAVGNVSLVTSLRFRQVFSDDISQIIDPRRESTFYVNNNAGAFSFNFLATNETTTLFRPAADPEASPVDGTNFDVKIRRAPEINLNVYPRRIFESLPIYLSFETAVGALKREETVDSEIVFITPSAVQRFDFQPRITVPLATIAGVAITPSLTLRETFYTSRLDSGVEAFDPDRFTLSVTDPRLDPAREEFEPGLKLFDRTMFDSVVAENLSRHYAELAVDVRPPTLEKVFLDEDGSRRFKHVIEPYLTYRLIRGVGEEFDEIIKFDERDVVANTNEVEYAIVNRFFSTRRPSELVRRRNRDRTDDEPDEMEPVSPGKEDRRRRKRDKKNRQDQTDLQPAPEKTEPEKTEPEKLDPAKDSPEQQKPEQAEPSPVEAPGPDEPQPEPSSEDEKKKKRLETGKSAELGRDAATRNARRKSVEQEGAQDEEPDDPQDKSSVDSIPPDELDSATNENAPGQAYEFLSIKVAQKYFFDRDFGGALREGERNQFYPINTLSGFTYGGRARSFSPVNVQVRYRPLSSIFADLRMDIGSDDKGVRNVTVTGGVSRDRVSVSTSWYLSRRINLDGNRFEPGTFPGNQIVTTIQFGDADRGFYGGTRIGYDFTNRFVTDTSVSTGRLRNSRSYVGYQFDCCGVQFNYNTFKAGLRNESAFSFTFTLAGLGSFGTDQFSQLGGGRGGRKRGKRARREINDDF
ncbi:MAG TPA: LPS assembly protein LptD, partial [Blastocatellia bacterium]|nr:LPS assembly protein LptD [Blastocatellia bacterium]